MKCYTVHLMHAFTTNVLKMAGSNTNKNFFFFRMKVIENITKNLTISFSGSRLPQLGLRRPTANSAMLGGGGGGGRAKWP